MSEPYQNFNNFMAQDSSRLVDKIYNINRAQGRISALIEKGSVPEQQGYNYSTVLYQRSSVDGAPTWSDIQEETGSSNNCVQPPATVNPALDKIAWTVQAMLLQTNNLCFEDLRRAYNVREQLDQVHEQFARKVTDIWEDSDNSAFFTNTGYKVIANSSLTQNYMSSDMPLTAPTTRAVQGILDIIYERISTDGGCEEAYAMADGQPLITAIMSQATHRNIIKEDASTRQDFNYAQMGDGFEATLLKGWGSDMKAYSGYHHVVNIRQPRYDWIGGAWVQRSFYTNASATIGTAEVLNTAYTNAAYEDIYLWHKQVVRRMMPTPGGSYGSGASFDPVKWNGAVIWRNVMNLDSASAAYNPLGNTGRYFAALQRGYQPVKKQYGYAIRVARCPIFTANACY